MFVSPSRPAFRLEDDRRRADLLDHQKLAVATYGPIDVVVANAGITEKKGWFDSQLDSRGNLKVKGALLIAELFH